MKSTDERFADLLKTIAKLIVKYEDPTGKNCSNSVVCVIEETECAKKFSFNGHTFVEIMEEKCQKPTQG